MQGGDGSSWLSFLARTPPSSMLSSLYNLLVSAGGRLHQSQPALPTTTSMATRKDRDIVAKDTLARTNEVVRSTPGASLDAEFLHDKDVAPLSRDACPGHPKARVRVVNSDSFTLARALLKELPGARVSVLNLASDEVPGGGWVYTLSRTQEEALCYSSTLYATLRDQWYPWDNAAVAGVFSPGVVVFKNDLDHACVDLPQEERVVVSVLTIAAPRGPPLKENDTKFAREQDVENIRAKTRLALRMSVSHGCDVVVLGAMGCGAYGCPPGQVSEEMRRVLLEDEFRGWFKLVTFAVYSKKDPRFVGGQNFDVFSKTFADVEV